MSRTIRVLLLAADPESGTAPMRVDREIRGAVEAARRNGAPGRVRVAAELAPRRDDLLPALLCHDPQVVHFAVHGLRGEALQLEDEEITAAELAALLPSAHRLRMVVLAACRSLPIAEVLAASVDYVVAMERRVDDAAAIHFTGVLYAGLAAGRPVLDAFEVARDSAEARFGHASGGPRLLVRRGAGTHGLVEPRAGGRRTRPSLEQVIDADGVDADGDVEILNHADMPAVHGSRQVNGARSIRAGGSVRIGNDVRLHPSPTSNGTRR